MTNPQQGGLFLGRRQPDVVMPEAVKTRLVPNLPNQGRLSLGGRSVPQPFDFHARQSQLRKAALA